MRSGSAANSPRSWTLYLVVLNSLPKSALAPLLIVWLGATKTTIIVAGMSVAIFGSILSLYTSFTIVDPGKIKLIYTLGGSRFHALTKVVLPSTIPTIISNNMKVNIGLCLQGVIIGEFLAARDGLGYLIICSSQVFKMDWLLMSIVLLCIMAMGLYSLINLLERIYLKAGMTLSLRARSMAGSKKLKCGFPRCHIKSLLIQRIFIYAFCPHILSSHPTLHQKDNAFLLKSFPDVLPAVLVSPARSRFAGLVPISGARPAPI